MTIARPRESVGFNIDSNRLFLSSSGIGHILTIVFSDYRILCGLLRTV
jgi:hypothetical protein